MSPRDVGSVEPSEVADLLAHGWRLLDVRTPDEWSAGRIPDSLHIPMSQLLGRLDEVQDPVICVCAVGSRSARVTQFLIAQGLEAVNLEGGIYAWTAAGLPVTAGG